MKKSRADWLNEMTAAASDLNMFEAVKAIMESGAMSADVQPADFNIIELCQKAQQKCLRRYDRALAALNSNQRNSND